MHFVVCDILVATEQLYDVCLTSSKCDVMSVTVNMPC